MIRILQCADDTKLIDGTEGRDESTSMGRIRLELSDVEEQDRIQVAAEMLIARESWKIFDGGVAIWV